MPRLFGRSSKEHHRDQYDYYGEYDPAQQQYPQQYAYGHEDDHYGPPADLSQRPSTWRRALSRKKSNKKSYHGEEQYLPPPDLYHDPSRRAAVEDYYEVDGPARPASTGTESFTELLSHSDFPIPEVQRESSLSRLQEAFADDGRYAPAISQQNSGMPSARGTPQFGPRPLPSGNGPIKLNAVNEMRHEPILVNNVSPEGIRPDVLHAPEVYRGREHRTERRELPRPPQNTPAQQYDLPAPPPQQFPRSYDSVSRGYGHEPRLDHRKSPEEYPPAVVVVEKGRHGKKDTYYIIPGGVPVVFEDEDGNELTRVGDFSGQYQPTKPRPIIVEDSHGREIFRTGFDDDRSSSSRSRYDDDYYRGEGHSSHHRSRPAHREDRYYDDRDDYSSSRGSSRRRDEYAEDMNYSRSAARREEAYGAYDGPNVVYIDPLGGRSPASMPIPSRSTSPRHIHLHAGNVDARRQEQQYSKPRSHDNRETSSSVIYLDDIRSQSSRSSGSRGKAYRETSRYR